MEKAQNAIMVMAASWSVCLQIKPELCVRSLSDHGQSIPLSNTAIRILDLLAFWDLVQFFTAGFFTRD